MAWVMIGSAVIGGVMANNAANKQSAAIDRANEQNNQYLNAVMPYIKDNIEGVKGSYQDMLAKGPYTGSWYAGPNNMQTAANGALYNMGMNNMSTGRNIMDQSSGFVGNANDLFSRFSGLANRPDMMSKATDYATNNMDPIVTALMRDDRRTLTEQTLPGINQAASGSGNANSSRAGVADALANRAYNDRVADVRSDVFNSLRNASLSQSNTEFDQANNALSNAGTANNALGNSFTTGSNLATAGGNTALGAGTNQQGWDQGAIDAARNQYDYTTGYNYNLGKDYGSFLSQGSPGAGNYQANMINPGMSTMAGAMQGFGFGNQYGQQIGNMIGNSSFGKKLFGNSTFGVGGYV